MIKDKIMKNTFVVLICIHIGIGSDKKEWGERVGCRDDRDIDYDIYVMWISGSE